MAQQRNNMKHYKLTEETKVINSVLLYRIELTDDCKWGSKGEKGGWIEKEDNLYDNAWVSGNAKVYGDAQVSGNAKVYGDAQVSDDAWVYGNAHVYGGNWEFSPLQIQGTRHYFNICKKGYIKIGCIEKTIEEWVEQFENIGKEQNYTDEQIKEYGLYIQLAKQLNK